jgi:Fe-S cluster assembly protein SufD
MDAFAQKMNESHLYPRPSFEVSEHALPNRHDEIWRFTPTDTALALVGDGVDAEADFRMSVNPPEGVGVGRSLDPAHGPVLVPVDRPSALAEARAGGAREVVIPEGLQAATPVVVALEGRDAENRSYSRLRIQAGAGSRAVVLLRHVGAARHLGNVEVVVGDEAVLTVVSLQEWDAASEHAGFTQASVGRDAHYRHVAVSFGGAFVRLQNNVSYAGPGGTAELYGLYLADAGQHLEHRLFVDQNQPHTVSRVDYRGALRGKGAHTVWIGDVLIRRNAEGIDSYEQNRNLVLTDGCIADSVPNLEIETGNIVGAGHSSSTGRFDDEQLFYLESRGIPEPEARRLVVQGFFYDIIRRIGVPDVEERLYGIVDAQLDGEEGTNG